MNMQNKLCIVTGANSGIGKATATELARQNAYVVMICRNEDRGLKAKEDIIQQTGNTGVELMLADFSYQYEIREVAEQISNKFEQVDVLVNNAGTIFHKREETLDGIEKTFAVNHLGPFLLTNLLLPHLKQAPEARIVNVASEAHRVGVPVFDLDNLQLNNNFGGMKAYGLSKLCNIMFTHELAKKLEGTNVTTNALHPGVISTNLASEASWWMKLLYFIGRPFMHSARKGARTSVFLATSDEVSNISGKYFKNERQTKPSAVAYDDELTSALWETSAELTGLKQVSKEPESFESNNF